MSEPMLSLYRSHDRELLFHGNIATAQARGIKIKRATGGGLSGGSVVLDGRRCKIVNYSVPVGGDVLLWIVA